MIEVTFTAPRRRGHAVERDLIATVRVGGTHFEIVGDQNSAGVRDIEVLDVASGQSVTFDADPERWARNLPQAFRSGDLVCEVVDDAAADPAAHEALSARA
jgi:hypothetical protein